MYTYLGGGGTPLGTLKHRPATQKNQFGKTHSQTHFMKQHRSTAVAMLGFQMYWQAATAIPNWHCTSLINTVTTACTHTSCSVTFTPVDWHLHDVKKFKLRLYLYFILTSSDGSLVPLCLWPNYEFNLIHTNNLWVDKIDALQPIKKGVHLGNAFQDSNYADRATGPAYLCERDTDGQKETHCCSTDLRTRKVMRTVPWACRGLW